MLENMPSTTRWWKGDKSRTISGVTGSISINPEGHTPGSRYMCYVAVMDAHEREGSNI